MTAAQLPGRQDQEQSVQGHRGTLGRPRASWLAGRYHGEPSEPSDWTQRADERERERELDRGLPPEVEHRKGADHERSGGESSGGGGGAAGQRPEGIEHEGGARGVTTI